MPTLPWSTVEQPAPTAEVVVMASHFRLRSFRHVLPFSVDAMRINRQVTRTEGAIGVSPVAHPLRREFFTLSAWRDRAALNAMVWAEPHRTVTGRYRAAMAESAFRFWTAPAADVPVGWDEAHRRLAESPA